MIRSALILTTLFAVSSSLLPKETPSIEPQETKMDAAPKQHHVSMDVARQIDGFHGVAKPSQQADLRSMVPGRIAIVHVREGQLVRKGEALVSLDDRVPQARLNVAKTEATLSGALQRAEVQLAMAQRRLSNIRRIVDEGAGASFELEMAIGERDQAATNVQQQSDVIATANANAALAAAQLTQYTITAPFDGLITEIHKTSGTIDMAEPVVSVANLTSLEVELHLNSNRFGQIRSGEIVNLDAGLPVNRLLQAEVLSVSPVINSASGTFRCLLRIDNQRQLPAGFSVTLPFEEHDSATQSASGRIKNIW